MFFVIYLITGDDEYLTIGLLTFSSILFLLTLVAWYQPEVENVEDWNELRGKNKLMFLCHLTLEEWRVSSQWQNYKHFIVNIAHFIVTVRNNRGWSWHCFDTTLLTSDYVNHVFVMLTIFLSKIFIRKGRKEVCIQTRSISALRSFKGTKSTTVKLPNYWAWFEELCRSRRKCLRLAPIEYIQNISKLLTTLRPRRLS